MKDEVLLFYYYHHDEVWFGWGLELLAFLKPNVIFISFLTNQIEVPEIIF